MQEWKRYPQYKETGVEWLGEVPEHWEVRKLKDLCYNSEVAKYGLSIPSKSFVNKNEGVRFLRTTDFNDKGEILDTNKVYVENKYLKNYKISKGDLLFSRSGTVGRSLNTSRIKEDFVYAGYLVKFKIKDIYQSNFFFFYSLSFNFLSNIKIGQISTTINNFNGKKYSNILFPLPPLEEQEAIANYLEKETSKIDTLVQELEEFVLLLQEERQSIISHTVTQGLNPNVPMKDSGVEWLGEVPEHWEVRKLKKLVNIISKKSLIPLDFKISLENIESNTGKFIIKEESIEYSDRGVFFKKNDILFNKLRPYLNKVYLSDKDGESYGDYFIMRIISNKIINSYLKYFLLNFKVTSFCTAISRGAKMPRVGWNYLSKFSIPLPPLEEQEAIAHYLEEKTGEIDTLISEKTALIQELKEYRQSIISHVVTGKIDIRG